MPVRATAPPAKASEATAFFFLLRRLRGVSNRVLESTIGEATRKTSREAPERVPESLARLTEALWLRAIDEVRQRVGAAGLSNSPQYEAFAAVEN
jgi:hypothetical protein